MLDDIKLLHERDSQDTLGIAERQWEQLGYECETFQQRIEVDNIVYAGMGSSAFAARLSSSWAGCTVPFEVVRDYDIPAYVSERTYFVAASSSGNTEETISAVTQAEAKGAKIAIIAGGGKLAELANDKGYPLAQFPKTEQARYAVFYNLKVLIDLLGQAGLVDAAACNTELQTAAEFLKNAVQSWIPTAPTSKNQAKQIALEVIGKSIVIYGGPKLAPAAYKWKIGFNENAKQVAWMNEYPEFNHNEFMGWTKQPVDKPYAVIDLRSKLDHPRVQKRFEVTERLLSGMRPAPIVVEAEGETLLEQLLWTITLGDFVTIYTALLNGLNPAPVDLVDKFKKLLEE